MEIILILTGVLLLSLLYFMWGEIDSLKREIADLSEDVDTLQNIEYVEPGRVRALEEKINSPV